MAQLSVPFAASRHHGGRPTRQKQFPGRPASRRKGWPLVGHGWHSEMGVRFRVDIVHPLKANAEAQRRQPQPDHRTRRDNCPHNARIGDPPYWPNIRRQPPITSRIPARTMMKLLQPHPAQGPYRPLPVYVAPSAEQSPRAHADRNSPAWNKVRRTRPQTAFSKRDLEAKQTACQGLRFGDQTSPTASSNPEIPPRTPRPVAIIIGQCFDDQSMSRNAPGLLTLRIVPARRRLGEFVEIFLCLCGGCR